MRERESERERERERERGRLELGWAGWELRDVRRSLLEGELIWRGPAAGMSRREEAEPSVGWAGLMDGET